MKKQTNKLLIFSLLMSMTMFFGCQTGSKVEPAPLIPLKDFFKNPEKSRYQISPDGKYFSYMAPYESRMNIFVQEIGQDSAKRLTSETDRNVAGYFWANNNRILFLKDTGGDENFKLYGVNIDGSNMICFTDFEGVLRDVESFLYP